MLVLTKSQIHAKTALQCFCSFSEKITYHYYTHSIQVGQAGCGIDTSFQTMYTIYN
jgi:hypothetical protein